MYTNRTKLYKVYKSAQTAQKVFMKQVIPGIKKLYIIPCSYLANYNAERAAAGENISISSHKREIDFEDEPTLQCESAYQNNGRLYKTTLKFRSPEDINLSAPLAFIAVDMLDNAHVIGTREKPYPMIKRTNVSGTTSKAAGTEYEITYNSTYYIYLAIL